MSIGNTMLKKGWIPIIFTIILMALPIAVNAQEAPKIDIFDAKAISCNRLYESTQKSFIELIQAKASEQDKKDAKSLQRELLEGQGCVAKKETKIMKVVNFTERAFTFAQPFLIYWQARKR